MCGIFGVVGHHIEYEVAVKCTDRMTHRGPDGGGVWQSNDGMVSFGHRRLAILDLTQEGKQPMPYADGRYWITFNGEIYNYLELKEELVRKGYTFRTNTDTEVIVAAFLEWGEQCVLRFNGMWAFAIYDNATHRTFISRDRFGVKPLFYTLYENGGVAFASEMKALLPAMEKVEPNRDFIQRVINGFSHYETQEECLFVGIKRFPAGRNGWITDGRIELTQYWNTLDHLVDVPERYEEQVEIFRELFLDACRIRMRSDVTLGTALSGGLDSSATICAMAHLAKEHRIPEVHADWQHAYVACFPGSWVDERKYAKQVTDHLGIESTFLDIQPVMSEEKFLQGIYLFEELWDAPQLPMMEIYRQERQEGTLVSLDGHAADELFAGYTFDIEKAIREVGMNVSKQRVITDCVWQLHNDSNFRPANTYSKYHRKTVIRQLAAHYSKVFRGQAEIDSINVNHEQWQRLGVLNQTLYVSTHETVLPTMLRNYDRDSMANGVEIRMPFLDYRIVCLAFSLDWNSKIRDGYSKAIIRDAIAPFAPEPIVRRRGKIGFNAPLDEYFRGPWKEMLTDLVHSGAFAKCDLIRDVNSTLSYFDHYMDGQSGSGFELWKKIQPFFWERAFSQNYQT